MNRGEVLTAVTIWITIIAYVTGSSIFALTQRKDRWARIIWMIACLSLLAHVASAFHFYHHWSHAAAYLDTTRQTYQVLGINWGGGIYFNYALIILWTIDVCWWWTAGLERYRRRPLWLVIAWQAFLVFMFFNATVVFGDGFERWLGVVMILGLGVVWLFAWRSFVRATKVVIRQ